MMGIEEYLECRKIVDEAEDLLRKAGFYDPGRFPQNAEGALQWIEETNRYLYETLGAQGWQRLRENDERMSQKASPELVRYVLGRDLP